MRNGFSNARQVVDLDDLFPVSASLAEVNRAERRVGTMAEEAGILRRAEDAGDDRYKQTIEYTKPLPEGGVGPLKGRGTNGSSFAQYR